MASVDTEPLFAYSLNTIAGNIKREFDGVTFTEKDPITLHVRTLAEKIATIPDNETPDIPDLIESIPVGSYFGASDIVAFLVTDNPVVAEWRDIQKRALLAQALARDIKSTVYGTNMGIESLDALKERGEYLKIQQRRLFQPAASSRKGTRI